MEDDPDSWKERLNVDTVRLSHFLSSAGQVCKVYFIKHVDIQLSSSTDFIVKNVFD